ncbi:hypothetical protein [Anaeromyxobacter diazotrophicus]|uniref:Uncharacterized protein n=1 Tax=Anaeromyxobacter diazotrophicus TaxID=2590199 RepID=A0A7I9VTQ4_9BACT|nr:hypothetical protein [Anaeromyxobacter diazotrophicus]GEJ59347.1 hypothetical protein AMYX_40880 [Anaeromyxobacter diazotrophicus]
MAEVLLFALDDLRARFGLAAAAGADPRQDTGPFRAFRAALLPALAAAAAAEAEASMWWEGGFNGYALAVALEPAGAVPGAEARAGPICPVDAVRLAPARRDRYPLARLAPGRYELARDETGALVEAPFGAPTGHFGAPGMRRLP